MWRLKRWERGHADEGEGEGEGEGQGTGMGIGGWADEEQGRGPECRQSQMKGRRSVGNAVWETKCNVVMQGASFTLRVGGVNFGDRACSSTGADYKSRTRQVECSRECSGECLLAGCLLLG